MKTIIGMDTHIATCDFYAVGNEGNVLEQGTFKTSAFNLRQVVRQIKGDDKVVVIEQGPLAPWISRVVRPYVSKVVVSEPRRNRWIAQDSVKNDRFDTEKLTVLYRGGFIKEVIQRDEGNEGLLRLVIQHHNLVRQRTQIKNQMKAKFRESGVRAAGTSVFNKKRRAEWLAQISNRHLLFPIQIKYEQLDLLDEQIDQTDRRLKAIIRRYPIVKSLMKKFPGIGIINAATFVALIDTPERFPSVKKLWTYCGLGLDIRGSGLKIGLPRLTQRGNRQLKYILKQAAITAVYQDKENAYRQWFETALKNGKPEYKAILTCARKLAKDMWLTWRDELRKDSKAA